MHMCPCHRFCMCEYSQWLCYARKCILLWLGSRFFDQYQQYQDQMVSQRNPNYDQLSGSLNHRYNASITSARGIEVCKYEHNYAHRNTNTQTYTHTLSPAFPRAHVLSLYPFLSLSLSQKHTHAHAQTHTHTIRIHTHIRTHTHALTQAVLLCEGSRYAEVDATRYVYLSNASIATAVVLLCICVRVRVRVCLHICLCLPRVHIPTTRTQVTLRR